MIAKTVTCFLLFPLISCKREDAGDKLISKQDVLPGYITLCVNNGIGLYQLMIKEGLTNEASFSTLEFQLQTDILRAVYLLKTANHSDQGKAFLLSAIERAKGTFRSNPIRLYRPTDIQYDFTEYDPILPRRWAARKEFILFLGENCVRSITGTEKS